MSAPTILISAGEASSDMYAARLAKAIRERTGAQFFGMGGPRMAEAGVELIADYHEVAVVGIAEVLHKIPTVVRVQNRLAREAERRKASLAILVDSPGTHLGVARRLKNRNIPVGYFIGPQIWAWRPGRVRVVKRLVKRMLVIFPFEEQIYRDAGVPVNFVGHPLAELVHASMTRAEFAVRHKLNAARPIVALLPGSRRKEIAQHYRTILDACAQITREHATHGAVQFVHATAPGIDLQRFAEYERSLGIDIRHVEGAVYDVLASADCAIVASGTATVEAAMIGTPMVVIYRVAPLTAAILRHMVRTRNFGMVNLIAGRRVAPELIQDDFTAANVAREVGRLLDSESEREKMKLALAEIHDKLGSGGAIERAADIFSGMLESVSSGN
jgi:lipid-A-disaccharide synthase